MRNANDVPGPRRGTPHLGERLGAVGGDASAAECGVLAGPDPMPSSPLPTASAGAAQRVGVPSAGALEVVLTGPPCAAIAA
jgi:hypothetical protein